ncbi:hypothetical protein Tb11.02.1565 [Trypanosoma brucei brucei TREU927]|uniref:Uncharacterized protein n=1 Tax=Trypanosoma brucei brucei (strain 927/4 GUTat10.1) TaxID=185431 RepID=Q386A7_TRYB2|nr:hypothetical protein Tb11.02.1565 [Trypanosoma brucei brucei TREU927]EAN79374.1 hypothetical protein Tb11.02.1565 [Trypanosoma brucei brucei TREU927]
MLSEMLLLLCILSVASVLSFEDMVTMTVSWPHNASCKGIQGDPRVCRALAVLVKDAFSSRCKTVTGDVRATTAEASCHLQFKINEETPLYYLCNGDTVREIMQKQEDLHLPAHTNGEPDCSKLPARIELSSDKDSKNAATVSAPANTEKESKGKPEESPATETSDNVTEKTVPEKPTIKGPQTKNEKTVDVKSTEPQSKQNSGSMRSLFGDRCFFIPLLYSMLL